MDLVIHGTKGSIHLINDDQVELLNESGQVVDVEPILALKQNAPGRGFSDVEGELVAFYEAVLLPAKLHVSRPRYSSLPSPPSHPKALN